MEYNLKLLRDEIKHVKKNSTKEELNKLNYTNFRGDNDANCIYGQLYGNASSKRAIEVKSEFNTFASDFSNLEEFLFDLGPSRNFTRSSKYYTVIEHIFNYLQGKVKNLNLKYYFKTLDIYNEN